MADQLIVTSAATLNQEIPPQIFRLLDASINLLPENYLSGKGVIEANSTNQLICSGMNMFFAFSVDGTFSICVGNTTSTVMTGVNYFIYNGDKTAFYITNSTANEVSIQWVAGATP